MTKLRDGAQHIHDSFYVIMRGEHKKENKSKIKRKHTDTIRLDTYANDLCKLRNENDMKNICSQTKRKRENIFWYMRMNMVFEVRNFWWECRSFNRPIHIKIQVMKAICLSFCVKNDFFY